jgi:hypothetical protein
MLSGNMTTSWVLKKQLSAISLQPSAWLGEVSGAQCALLFALTVDFIRKILD